MNNAGMRVLPLLCVLGIVATGCTSSPEDPEGASANSGSSTTLSGAAESDVSVIVGADGEADDSDEQDPNQDVAPARRVPSQISSESSHWIGVNTMTDSEVSVVWSEVEGDDVVYQLFRFDSIGLNRDTVELVTPIHEAIGVLEWTDNSVHQGNFYTYVMRVIADDEVLERRWTNTLAVTDVTPPSTIEDLAWSTTDDGILLEWSPASDDVEFGSYGVFRTDLAEEPQYVGGGGDIAVTSFLDDDIPASGEIGYEVIAYDFHGNRSEPTAVTISLG